MKRELERVEIADEREARERTWAVVAAAFAQREPVPRRRSWKPAVAVALAVAALAALLSPPGRAMLDELREVVGVENADRALFSLPADGRLLVVSDAGAWVVEPDGSKRLLGPYRDASWSPFGRFVAAARANELAALTPGGDLRWTLARPDVRFPRWGGTRTDTRIAYFSRGRLRVVGGDGKGDRLLDADAALRPPSWLPGAAHRLAYLRRDGSVRIVDADSGAVVDPSAARSLVQPRPTISPDGRWRVVGWADADQLVFTRIGTPRQIRAVSDVSAQFRSRSFPTISGWCCAR
ncbi:MAG TPA: hypothetical protein VIA10_02280 [Gaiellaceae bacterium]